MRPRHSTQRRWILYLMFMAGCHPPATTLPRPLAVAEKDEQDRLTLYEAGEVLAGAPIQHTFRFQNPTQSVLQLAIPDGVQASCGCARATVADKRLAPGQSTSVVVHVRTEGREGQLSEVVETNWEDGGNNQLAFAFAVRATVTNGLALNPPDLTFAKQEVAQGTVKRVRCTSDLPIDWKTATVVAEAEYLEVDSPVALPGGQGIQFHVACHPRSSGASRQDHLLITADGPRPNSTTIHSFSVRLPVYSNDPAPLRVSPPLATLRRKTDGTAWTGTLFVFGDAIETGTRVTHITCAGATTSFRASRIAECALRIDLEYAPTQESGQLPTQSLDLILTGGRRQRVLVRLLTPAQPLSRDDQLESDICRFRVADCGSLTAPP